MSVWYRRGGVWLLWSVLVVILDQWSKSWMNTHLVLGESVRVCPFLNWTLSYNTGAAFSFLSHQGGWQVILFSVVSVVVICVLCVVLCRTALRDWCIGLGMSSVLGGAVGNLIDRILFHRVTDFIDVHWGSWHFATFNVADTMISVGVVLLFFSWIVSSEPTESQSSSSSCEE